MSHRALSHILVTERDVPSVLRDGVRPAVSLGKGSRKEEKFGSADRAHPWEAAEYSDAGETVKHA